MKLATLRTKLSVIAGTNIGQVFFDWKSYLNITRSKTYPVALWSFDNAKFVNDIRTLDIQQIKDFTITVFAIMNYKIGDDKIPIWDTLEQYFYDYLNKINTNDMVVQIYNIDKINGQYIPEGMISADSEIGIMADIILRTYCLD